MKTTIIGLILFFGSLTIIAQNTQTEKFKVEGNCGMCKTRIQNAALYINGVTMANWDKETKILQVTFNPSKTDLQQIHLVIAKVGHDTDKHKAPEDAYKKLPGCCKYR